MRTLNQIKEGIRTLKSLVKSTAAAIIVENGKILLERRSSIVEKGKWGLPGGHMEFGEKAIETIRREIKEELGVRSKNIKFLGYHDEIMKRKRLHSLVLIFKLDIEGKIKVDKNESYEARWFSKKELKGLNFAFTHKEIINKYFLKGK